MTSTYGQTTAATHAMYRPRPLTHAEQRTQLLDRLERDDDEVAG